MAFKFNPFSGCLDYFSNESNITISATEPTGVEGKMYINSTSNELYLFYDSSWHLLHSFGDAYLFLENGDYVLLENGDKFILG